MEAVAVNKPKKIKTNVNRLVKQLFAVVLIMVMTIIIAVPVEASRSADIRSGAQAAGQQLTEAIEIIMARYMGSHVSVNNLAGAALSGMARHANISITAEASRNITNRGEAQAAGQQLAHVVEVIMTQRSGSDITVNALMEAGLRGMTDVLDQHSTYMNAVELARFANAMTGRLFGIGVEMAAREDGSAIISRVFPHSPAHAAGVRSGDVIMYINRQSVAGMSLDAITARIVDPANQRVHIIAGRGGQIHAFNIAKAEIRSPTVIVERMPGIRGLGDLSGFRHVHITSVSLTTGDDVQRALNQMQREGVRGIVLDLRGNTGGYLNVTIDIGRQLVPQGIILQTIDRSGSRRIYSSSLGQVPFNNVVVLVDRYTASAAEVLASALQDSGAAVVIGENTFGKGLVQSVYSLRNGGAMVLTTEEYFRRDGRRINGVGVVPCISVSGIQAAHEDMDIALLVALEVLSRR